MFLMNTNTVILMNINFSACGLWPHNKGATPLKVDIGYVFEQTLAVVRQVVGDAQKGFTNVNLATNK